MKAPGSTVLSKIFKQTGRFEVAVIIPLVILAIVFFLTAVRQVGNVRLGIWQIMSLGAAGVLLTGQISIASAIKAVNVDVLLFLFGMFAIGQALEMSGYLSHLSYRFF